MSLYHSFEGDLIEYEVKKTAPHLRMPTSINTLIHSWDLKWLHHFAFNTLMHRKFTIQQHKMFGCTRPQIFAGAKGDN
jgi:hypothetical protein